MRLKISFALFVGLCGLVIAGANLPIDTQLTIRTKLGKRTQPHWLVPTDSKVVKSEGGSGLIRLLGGLIGCAGFGAAMHLAGTDERQQKLFWDKQIAINSIHQKESKVSTEIGVGVRLKKLQMDAQAEVDFYSLELQGKFREAIGFVPAASTQASLPYGKPGTLDEIANPADKIKHDEVLNLEPEDLSNQPKMPLLTWYPSVLIYGAPGSGKSTFAAEEITKRKAAGHQIIVLDPHAAYGAWQGCEVVGGGMDYTAIDAKLAWFALELGKRYKIVQTQPNPKFRPLTFVCDEFTHWGSKCAKSAEFFEQLVTDIRKVEMFGLIISHTRTLAGLANAKGFASLRDEALLEIEILGNLNKETGRATPRFEAMVKLPGTPLNNRTLIKLTRHSTTPRANEPTTEPNPTETNSVYLERTYKLEFDLSKPGPENEPSEPTPEPLNQPQDSASSESEPKFTTLELDRKQVIDLIQRLQNELNQTQIIERLWDCKKGGSDAWRRAYAQFKKLTE